MHDPANDAFAVFTQLERDPHRLVRVPLKLHQTHPSDVFDFRQAVTVGTLKGPAKPAVVHERCEASAYWACRRWGNPDCILAVDFVGNDVVTLK